MVPARDPDPAAPGRNGKEKEAGMKNTQQKLVDRILLLPSLFARLRDHINTQPDAKKIHHLSLKFSKRFIPKSFFTPGPKDDEILAWLDALFMSLVTGFELLAKGAGCEDVLNEAMQDTQTETCPGCGVRYVKPSAACPSLRGGE